MIPQQPTQTMIIHQSDQSNLLVNLDPETGLVAAWMGLDLVAANTVEVNNDYRSMVREARQWIVDNGWWS